MKTTETQRRLPSLDFLRGFAMMGLVLVHSVLFLGGSGDQIDPIQLVFGYILGDLGAALFTTLVGLAFILSTQSQPGLTQRTVISAALIRGLLLIALSICFSVFVAGAEAIFEIDVLVLIGIASIVIALLRPLPTWSLLILAAGIILAAPPLRAALDYAGHWGGMLKSVDGLPVAGILMHPVQYFEPGFDLAAGAAGLLAVGWFALFPWLAFPIIGLVIGRLITGNVLRSAAAWMIAAVLFFAAAVTMVTVALNKGDTDPISGYITTLSFTPDSTSMIALQIGLVLFLLGVTHLWLNRPHADRSWMFPFLLVGRRSLTVYSLSWIAIGAAIRIADAIDPGKRHYQNLTDSTWAILLGLAFLAVILPVLAIWDRKGGVGTLEWVMQSLRRIPARRHPAPTAAQRLTWKELLSIITAFPILFGLLTLVLLLVLSLFSIVAVLVRV